MTERAKIIMKELSALEGDMDRPVFTSSDEKQISFFDNPEGEEAEYTEEEIKKLGELRAEIENIDVNHLTPVGALEMLFKLQQKVKG